MGFFRFRRSISLFPGVRLNVGKRGLSVSAGVPGAHVTIGKRGTRTTLGLPGTGLSYTSLRKESPRAQGAEMDMDRLRSFVAKKDEMFLMAVLVPAIIFGGGFFIALYAAANDHADAFMWIFVVTLLATIPPAWIGYSQLQNQKRVATAFLAQRNLALQALESSQHVSVYYFFGGKVLGPVALFSIISLIVAGTLPDDVQICRLGEEAWEQVPAEALKFARSINE